MATSVRLPLAVVTLLIVSGSGLSQTPLTFNFKASDTITSILGKLVGVQKCFKCSVMNVVNNGRVRKLSEAVTTCMKLMTPRPTPSGWPHPVFPPYMRYPGFFAPGMSPVWLQAFAAGQASRSVAAAGAAASAAAAARGTNKTVAKPTPAAATSTQSSKGRRKRQVPRPFPYGQFVNPYFAGLLPGSSALTMGAFNMPTAQGGVVGNQVDARIRCVLSELSLVDKNRVLSKDALHKLIEGIVSDEQGKTRLISISDACFKQSTRSSHSLTYYLTHPNQDSQETVYVKCIVGKLEYACRKEFTDKYNPMKAEMLRLRQSRCLLSDLHPNKEMLFKTISCVGETFKVVSQAFAKETRTNAKRPALSVSADTCRRQPFLLDPLVTMLKLPAAFSVTAERLAVQSMAQCLLHELGVFASFAVPVSGEAVKKVVGAMHGTLLTKNKLIQASNSCISATPKPKDKAELVTYINCVLDLLGDDCPNYSKDKETASFFEIIPTFLGERSGTAERNPADKDKSQASSSPGASTATPTRRPSGTTRPPSSNASKTTAHSRANTTNTTPRTRTNGTRTTPSAAPARTPPTPDTRPVLFANPFAVFGPRPAGPFTPGFGSFGGFSGMPAAPQPGLTAFGMFSRVKRQPGGAAGAGRQPRPAWSAADGMGSAPAARAVLARVGQAEDHRPAYIVQHGASDGMGSAPAARALLARDGQAEDHRPAYIVQHGASDGERLGKLTANADGMQPTDIGDKAKTHAKVTREVSEHAEQTGKYHQTTVNVHSTDGKRPVRGRMEIELL